MSRRHKRLGKPRLSKKERIELIRDAIAKAAAHYLKLHSRVRDFNNPIDAARIAKAEQKRLTKAAKRVRRAEKLSKVAKKLQGNK